MNESGCGGLCGGSTVNGAWEKKENIQMCLFLLKFTPHILSTASILIGSVDKKCLLISKKILRNSNRECNKTDDIQESKVP